MNKELSVIIPAYNEEERIVSTLSEVAEYLKNAHYKFEIIVVNDGSTDGTASKINVLMKIYPEIILVNQSRNAGKGEAVRRGIFMAKYAYCLFMDADNSTSIKEWDKFEKAFDRGFQVAIASRHLPESKIKHPQPFTRRFLGGGYRSLSRGLFGLKASDFNCGFKAYHTEAAKKIYAESRKNDWTFDVEIFCLMRKYKLNFTEIPVVWTHEQKKFQLNTASQITTSFKSLFSLIGMKSRF